jgi:hypothetical protein
MQSFLKHWIPLVNHVRRIKLKRSTTVTESTRVAKKYNLLAENKREHYHKSMRVGKAWMGLPSR